MLDSYLPAFFVVIFRLLPLHKHADYLLGPPSATPGWTLAHRFPLACLIPFIVAPIRSTVRWTFPLFGGAGNTTSPPLDGSGHTTTPPLYEELYITPPSQEGGGHTTPPQLGWKKG